MADDSLAIGEETLINQEARHQWSTKTHLFQLCGVCCVLCAVCCMSCVVCPVSCVACRVSCVACRVSRVACRVSRVLRPNHGGEAAPAESLTSLRRSWETSSEQRTLAKCIGDKNIKSCPTPKYGCSVRARCGNDCDVSLSV